MLGDRQSHGGGILAEAEDGHSPLSGLGFQPFDAFVFVSPEPVVDRLLAEAEDVSYFLRLTALSFEQDHLATGAKDVGVAGTIALLEFGALLFIEVNFNRSAHLSITLA